MNKYLLALLLVPALVFGVNTNKVDNIWIPSSIRISAGIPGIGKALVSDANGFGIWTTLGGGGDVFQTGINTYTGSTSTNYYNTSARIGVNTNVLKATSWIYMQANPTVEDLAHTDLLPSGGSSWRAFSGATAVGSLGFGTLGPIIKTALAGGNVMLRDSNDDDQVKVTLDAVTLGKDSSSTVFIPAATVTAANGLNINAGQFRMFPSGTNSMDALLGINTTVPTHSLTFGSTATDIAIYNTADQITNFERTRIGYTNNMFSIASEVQGTGTLRNLKIESISAGGTFAQLEFGRQTIPFLSVTGTSTSLSGNMFVFSQPLIGSSGEQNQFNIVPRISQSGTASYRALVVNPTEISVGTGTNLIFDAQVSGVSKFKVGTDGVSTFGGNADGGGNLLTNWANLSSLGSRAAWSWYLPALTDNDQANRGRATLTMAAFGGGSSVQQVDGATGGSTLYKLPTITAGKSVICRTIFGTKAAETNAASAVVNVRHVVTWATNLTTFSEDSPNAGSGEQGSSNVVVGVTVTNTSRIFEGITTNAIPSNARFITVETLRNGSDAGDTMTTNAYWLNLEVELIP